MRLGVTIPLKPRVASRDWQATCELLEGTLRSLAGQSCREFRVVVVGHDKPYIDFGKYEFASFHRLEVPVPPLRDGGSYEYRADFNRIHDKNTKIVRGMQLLRDAEITDWYYLDADDLLRHDFVAAVAKAGGSNGVLIDNGYIFYRRARRLRRVNNLSEICGSTSVLPDSLVNIPTKLDADSLKSVPWCRYSHADMAKFFSDEVGVEPMRISDPVLAYVLDHGDNASDEFRRSPMKALKSKLKPLLLGARFDDAVLRKFSVRS